MKLDFKSKCACGEKLTIEIKKPTPMEVTIAKIKCHGCGSRYIASCTAVKGARPKQVKFDFDVIELSEKLKDILEPKKRTA